MSDFYKYRFYYVTYRDHWLNKAAIMSFDSVSELCWQGEDGCIDEVRVFDMTDHSIEYEVVNDNNPDYDGSYILTDRETGEIVDEAHWICH